VKKCERQPRHVRDWPAILIYIFMVRLNSLIATHRSGTGRATSTVTRSADGVETQAGASQMAQDNGGRGNASEDTTEAREHMRNVRENTEALAAEARRVEATAPAGTDRPVQGTRTDGMGGEDNRMAAENQRNVQENTEALRDQARLVDATAPASTDRPIQGLHAEGAGGEDNRMAAENVRSVQENTEALRDQARRVDATTPDDVNRTGPQDR
jgi:hypothetical protein